MNVVVTDVGAESLALLLLLKRHSVEGSPKVHSRIGLVGFTRKATGDGRCGYCMGSSSRIQIGIPVQCNGLDVACPLNLE